MKAIYITEGEVASLVNITDAVAALDECFKDWPDAGKGNLTRGRARQANGSFNLLGASYGRKNVLGLKAYFGAPRGTRYHVMLYSSLTGKLIAVIESDYMGQLRTGAASGIATKLLSRADASTLAVIGTGRQAFAQVAAVAVVRKLSHVRVFSRNAEKRQAFAHKIERELGLDSVGLDSAETCVSGADIITTITKSPDPVLQGQWISPGAHVNAAGANSANRKELDSELVRRADIRTTDSLAQARIEAGEYIEGAKCSAFSWTDIIELGDIASGLVAGRTNAHQITLFKSLGIGLEDVAIGELVYQRAISAGMGKELF